MNIPVILDTDIGSNVDDALALSYLLREPRCELLGITTVSGEPHKRASIADAVCKSANKRNIPIFVGEEQPLVAPQKQPKTPHYDSLGDVEYSDFQNVSTALPFLSRTLRSRPGEVVLLTIGPLTNIARLFKMDREAPALLRGIVVMGGEYFNLNPFAQSEWNMSCDPDAAAIVLDCSAEIRLLGLDVTRKCSMTEADCQRKLTDAGDTMSLVSRMCTDWFQGKDIVTLHDPLAAISIFHQNVCDWTNAKIDVEITDAARLGRTVLCKPQADNIKIAANVDPSMFFNKYFGIVK
jgi:purine nucleosidase